MRFSVDEAAAEDALTRFGALLADERHATRELQHAEEHLDDTREQLERMQAERAALGRIFHRHERAALDTHIAGHENALAYWQERVDHAKSSSAKRSRTVRSGSPSTAR